MTKLVQTGYFNPADNTMKLSERDTRMRYGPCAVKPYRNMSVTVLNAARWQPYKLNNTTSRLEGSNVVKDAISISLYRFSNATDTPVRWKSCHSDPGFAPGHQLLMHWSAAAQENKMFTFLMPPWLVRVKMIMLTLTLHVLIHFFAGFRSQFLLFSYYSSKLMYLFCWGIPYRSQCVFVVEFHFHPCLTLTRLIRAVLQNINVIILSWQQKILPFNTDHVKTESQPSSQSPAASRLQYASSFN